MGKSMSKDALGAALTLVAICLIYIARGYRVAQLGAYLSKGTGGGASPLPLQLALSPPWNPSPNWNLYYRGEGPCGDIIKFFILCVWWINQKYQILRESIRIWGL